MTRVVIIEDEHLAAEWLRSQVESIDADMQVVAIIDSVEQAILQLPKENADVIFCDIHLADGISFSIFERIQVLTPVIFTTAYDQYAIKAFQVNSIDYLLKPIESEALAAAIHKFRQRTSPYPDLQQALRMLTSKPKYQERYLVSTGQKLKSVPVETIAYFFADNKLNFLCDTEGRQYLIDQSLDKLEAQLDPDIFFRINRQYIVCFSAIREMVHYSKSRVKITLHPTPSGDTIVSAERSAAFKAWLNR